MLPMRMLRRLCTAAPVSVLTLADGWQVVPLFPESSDGRVLFFMLSGTAKWDVWIEIANFPWTR